MWVDSGLMDGGLWSSFIKKRERKLEKERL